jgi:hypothetical protein
MELRAAVAAVLLEGPGRLQRDYWEALDKFDRMQELILPRLGLGHVTDRIGEEAARILLRIIADLRWSSRSLSAPPNWPTSARDPGAFFIPDAHLGAWCTTLRSAFDRHHHADSLAIHRNEHWVEIAFHPKSYLSKWERAPNKVDVSRVQRNPTRCCICPAVAA